MGSEREKVQRKRKIHSLLNFSPSQMFSLFTSIFSLSYFSPSLHSSLWEKERESGGRKREREREKWGERENAEKEKNTKISPEIFSVSSPTFSLEFFLPLLRIFLSWTHPVFTRSLSHFSLLLSLEMVFFPPLSQNGFLSRNGFLSPSNFISGFL